MTHLSPLSFPPLPSSTHYIIQVDNNTQLETTDLTYNVDVMYNDTLFVNISAHNCAGYSDSFSITIEFNHEESKG